LRRILPFLRESEVDVSTVQGVGDGAEPVPGAVVTDAATVAAVRRERLRTTGFGLQGATTDIRTA
jgi:hypothetical protein